MSFWSETKSLRSGGTTRRSACGTTTKRMVCPRPSPSAAALATWEGWIDSMPARKTSATYAPYDSTSPTPAQNSALLGMPCSWSAGMPNPSSRISRIVGIPRKRSV